MEVVVVKAKVIELVVLHILQLEDTKYLIESLLTVLEGYNSHKYRSLIDDSHYLYVMIFV